MAYSKPLGPVFSAYKKTQGLGFHDSKADTSLYIYHTSYVIIYILVYVDDIIITGPSLAAIDQLINELNSDFAVKDLGSLRFFIGVEVVSYDGGLFLTQRRYIVDLLKRSSMDKAKPCLTPMATTTSLTADHGESFEDPQLYRNNVGGLQYLSFTRPDFAFAVHKNLISWSCKQQQTIARSSTEAKYKPLANAAAEIQWL
ncbi:hypothetical protein F2P56_011588 [Juglans regia]|uniref:Reverse transcriptase Ty1/copia-type domain-containing protein n=1 Tax=Juglans regia TaxID=51240 RepID=A0A834CZS5_JUGRE|nr:hypothetical protein F2P56_011588 [Juglans regia]